LLKKILMIVLGSLVITVVAVVGVLTIKQKESTVQSFSEQEASLMQFSVDNVELGLSTGRIDAVKKTLHQLQSYSIFAGSIVYDEDLTPILAIPNTFEISPEQEEEMGDGSKITQGHLSYERDILKDEDGDPIGHLLIAFTFEPVEAVIVSLGEWEKNPRLPGEDFSMLAVWNITVSRAIPFMI